jgi:hypothetical protein
MCAQMSSNSNLSEGQISLSDAAKNLSSTAAEATEITFSSFFSFLPLIQFWQKHPVFGGDSPPIAARNIFKEIKKHPELLEPIEDLAAIKSNQEVIDYLMSAIFPQVTWDQDFVAMLRPSDLVSFYASPAFKNTFLDLTGKIKVEPLCTWPKTKLHHSFALGSLILKQHFEVNVTAPEIPMVLQVGDSKSGTQKYYEMSFDHRFVNTISVGTNKTPSAVDLQLLQNNRDSVTYWANIVPEDSYEIEGFVIARAKDITEAYMGKILEEALHVKGPLLANPKFDVARSTLRFLMQDSTVDFAIGVADTDSIYRIESSAVSQHGNILLDGSVFQKDQCEGSVIAQVLRTGKLANRQEDTDVNRDNAMDKGLQSTRRTESFLVVPMIDESGTFGFFEVINRVAQRFNQRQVEIACRIAKIMMPALRLEFDAANFQVQKIATEKFSAVHPAVSWKFQDIGRQLMSNKSSDADPKNLTIRFKDVFPLFGRSEVRGVGELQIKATQNDLLTHVRFAANLLGEAYAIAPMPMLLEIQFRLSGYLERISKAPLQISDEQAVTAFIATEVAPAFEALQNSGKCLDKVADYLAQVIPESGSFFAERRRVQISFDGIVNGISYYVKQQQELAQESYPHYSTRGLSDGIQFKMFIGQAIAPNKKFSNFHLRNLRLWQLQAMCGCVLTCEIIKSTLEIPLLSAHWIAVHGTPLGIRFDADEKQFVSDESMDPFHQLIKDADRLKGQAAWEKIVEPGKIAILFTDHREKAEYLEFTQFLIHKGILKAGLEEGEVTGLPGLNGLKFLKVKVSLDGQSKKK